MTIKSIEYRVLPPDSEYAVNNRDKISFSSPPDKIKDYRFSSLIELIDQPLSKGLLIIDPSYECNIKCSFCVFSGRDTNIVDWELVSLPLKTLALSGLRRVMISGGEPGIFPKLGEWLRDLRSWGYKDIRLMTNGTWATDISAVHSMLGDGVTCVTMSLKGCSPETAESITGNRALYTQQIIAAGYFAQAAERGLLSDVHLNIVVTNDVLNELIQLRWLEDIPYGIILDFSLVEPYKAGDEDLVPEADQFSRKFSRVLSACNKRGLKTLVEGVPICKLGKFRIFDTSRLRLKDDRIRIFVNPANKTQQIYAHYGFQRLLQYGHRSTCKGCVIYDKCWGPHKRFKEDWTGQPLTDFPEDWDTDKDVLYDAE